MRVIYIEILLIFAIACSIHSLASSKPDANDHIRNERMQLDMIVQEDAKLEAVRLLIVLLVKLIMHSILPFWVNNLR